MAFFRQKYLCGGTSLGAVVATQRCISLHSCTGDSLLEQTCLEAWFLVGGWLLWMHVRERERKSDKKTSCKRCLYLCFRLLGAKSRHSKDRTASQSRSSVALGVSGGQASWGGPVLTPHVPTADLESGPESISALPLLFFFSSLPLFLLNQKTDQFWVVTSRKC